MKTILQKLRFLLPGLLLAMAAMALLLLFDTGSGLMHGFNALITCGAESLKYRTAVRSPDADWQISALVGIFLGGILFSSFSGNFKFALSYGSGNTFGNIARTALCGIAGGFLVMCGAAISGNGIWGHLTGAMQLSAGSWLFLAAALFAGMTTSLLASASDRDGKDSSPGDKKSAKKKKSAKNSAKKGAKK